MAEAAAWSGIGWPDDDLVAEMPQVVAGEYRVAGAHVAGDRARVTGEPSGIGWPALPEGDDPAERGWMTGSRGVPGRSVQSHSGEPVTAAKPASEATPERATDGASVYEAGGDVSRETWRASWAPSPHRVADAEGDERGVRDVRSTGDPDGADRSAHVGATTAVWAAGSNAEPVSAVSNALADAAVATDRSTGADGTDAYGADATDASGADAAGAGASGGGHEREHGAHPAPAEGGSDPVSGARAFDDVAANDVRAGEVRADGGAAESGPPDVAPVAPEQADPAADPVTGPAAEPVAGPVTDPVTGPVTEPVAGPVTDPVTGPVTEPVTGLDEAGYPAAAGYPADVDEADVDEAAGATAGSAVTLNLGEMLPPPDRTRVMVVANQKGGVGKTTTAVNMAAALAGYGARVLVVDVDPQGNASTALGIDHHEDVVGVYEVLIGGAAIDEVVQEATHLPGLHGVPATIKLAGAEIELVSLVARESRLKRPLDAYLTACEERGERYDYVFIDCPPSLGLLTLNALVAAREALIPIQCEYYALEGVSQLLRTIELVRGQLNPELLVSTVLLTMYDGRTRLAAGVADEVRAHFGERVLRTAVPRSVRISEAPSYGQTVITHDPTSSGALSYLEAAREFAVDEEVGQTDEPTTAGGSQVLAGNGAVGATDHG